MNISRIYDHIKKREGFVNKSYLDSLGKLTGGAGHLLSQVESKQYPLGTTIPYVVIDKWLSYDIQKSMTAAGDQAAQLGISDERFKEALVSVNFQLGINWTRKFPTHWENMMIGNYIGAIAEVIYTTEGSGVHSTWFKQTPVRVEDYTKAIMSLIFKC